MLARVVKLTSTYPGFVQRCKEGERDPISEWFAGEHVYGEFRGRGTELIEIGQPVRGGVPVCWPWFILERDGRSGPGLGNPASTG